MGTVVSGDGTSIAFDQYGQGPPVVLVGGAFQYLAVAGGNSPAWIHHGVQALTDVLPNAEHRILDGQTHMVKPKALAPMLTEFFTRR